ncbi:hypothetical protein [Sulfoacidibacillus ferrooxidans]|uniref:Uncharacterized protein n=1 Tax=Sulfoacidibacillus ferrooxidans TaxID=2005001 RepID=A0A9X1VBN3_9BACL|nr:hypothetical protein [Sulfoacidibacillus ferrooxidans]MCI0184755.1 hypothetical protein [Sulfoacidibacillus ferrooxidans]
MEEKEWDIIIRRVARLYEKTVVDMVVFLSKRESLAIVLQLMGYNDSEKETHRLSSKELKALESYFRRFGCVLPQEVVLRSVCAEAVRHG